MMMTGNDNAADIQSQQQQQQQLELLTRRA